MSFNLKVSCCHKHEMAEVCVIYPFSYTLSDRILFSHAAGKLEMATTVFGEDDNLSDHSSLISEGSAIAQIERELQEVVAGHGRQGSKGLPTTFLSPPLHLHPSHSDDGDDVSESLADSSPPHSSPGYIPTALEQRSEVIGYYNICAVV